MRAWRGITRSLSKISHSCLSMQKARNLQLAKKYRSYDWRAYFWTSPLCLPEKGVHDQGVPSNAHCSNHQDKEGNSVVNVVLDIHLAIESMFHVHLCNNKHTQTDVNISLYLYLIFVSSSLSYKTNLPLRHSDPLNSPAVCKSAYHHQQVICLGAQIKIR